jgi:GT2 family glycosyltransferase
MCSKRPHAKVLFIVVHYKTETAALALLKSLQNLKEFHEADVVIVDNASGAEHIARLRSALSMVENARLIESPLNRGYFGAATLALDQYREKGCGLPDWVIVSNSDILVDDQSFLDKLLRLESSSLGMVAPRVIVPPWNLNQNPYLRTRPRRLRRFTMHIFSHDYFLAVAWDWLSRAKRDIGFGMVRKLRSAVDESANETIHVPIYAPHGSFMVFSRRYFEAGGYLDCELFLYAEEVSVGENCRRLGLPVVYVPFLSVVHNEHQSLGIGVTRSMFIHQQRSIRHVLSKYLTP